MSTIKFAGFATGTSVTIGGITVNAWGQVEGGGTVWDQPASAGVGVSLSVARSPIQVAPEAAFVSVTLSGFDVNSPTNVALADPTVRDKLYWWDFGHGEIATAPTKVIEMDTADGGNRTNSRYQVGPIGTHVYTTPDVTYTGRVAVYEPSSGKWGQGTFTFSTGNPDTYYSGSATLFVDTSGQHSNAPVGAQTFTDLATAFAALNAASTPHRIVLERGQTHNVASRLTYAPASGSTLSFRVEAAPGNGALPLINATQSSGADGDLFLDATFENANPSASSTVFSNLEMAGTWDTTDESGFWDVKLINLAGKSSEHAVVDSCDLHNANRCVSQTADITGVRNDRLRLLHNTRMYDWSDYGWFTDASRTAAVGCRFTQNPQSIVGGDKEDPHNNHGPMRGPFINEWIIHACDIFSATGWSAASGGGRAIQPGIRAFTANTSLTYGRFIVTQCAVESPGVCINPVAASSSTTAVPGNILIQQNVLVGGHQTDSIVASSTGNMTVRWNAMVLPDCARSLDFQGFVKGSNHVVHTSATVSGDIEVDENDFINLSSDSGVSWFNEDSAFTGSIEVDRNIVHQPSLVTPQVTYAPLSFTSMFTARYEGYRDEDGSAVDTATATPTSTPRVAAPATGSAALDVGGNQVAGAANLNEDYRAD
ncbi:MAG: hypothetical protein ABJ360_22620 [Roseobacter sp.]